MSNSNPAKKWPPHDNKYYQDEATKVLGSELVAKFSQIKLMVFDVDGVMTPGNLIYGSEGETLKEFFCHDGLGLVMARSTGTKLAVLTGRNSPVVARRFSELRFDSIKLGRVDKVVALHEIFAETGCKAEETLYMGDDMIDLPAMYEVGVPVAVPAAPTEVIQHCLYTTKAHGGAGAVREIAELVLKASNNYAAALTRLCEDTWHPSVNISQKTQSDGVEES